MSNTYYNQRRLNLLFWLTNLAVVALLGVFVLRELQPGWRPYQERFSRLEQEIVGGELARAQEGLKADPEYAAAGSALSEAERASASQHYRALRERLAQLQLRQARAARALQQARAQLIRAEDEYFHARGGRRKWRAAVETLQQETLALGQKAQAWSRELAAVQVQVDSALASHRGARKRLNKLENPVRLLESWVASARARHPQIRQIVNEELGIVDRCVSCHFGIDKLDFDRADVPRVLRYHPRYDELLKPHPIGKFGCTPCHRGQGSALTQNAAHGYVPHWDTPFLPVEYRDAACHTCHPDASDLALAPHLSAGKRLFELAGCFGCHETRGYENAPRFGPDLSRVATKLTPQWAVEWVRNPRRFSPRTRMPDFSLTEQQARAIVSYLWRHSARPNTSPQPEPPGDPASGKRLAEDVGCYACHTLRGKGAYHPLPGKRPFAPDLSNVGSKVSAGWLYAWLKNPKGYFPKARMPNLRLTNQEAAHITAYLLTLRQADQQRYDSATGLQEGTAIEQGTKPPGVRRVGRPIASPYRVVSFRRRPGDARPAIWWQNAGLAREGEHLIGEFGCFGCHEIPGMQGRSKVAVELSAEGSKDIHQLDFGRKVYDIAHTRHDWLLAKLLDPRQFRDGLRMPDFHLSRDEAQMLVTALLGFTEEQAPPSHARTLSETERWMEEGRRLVQRRNCTGCHRIEGKGGDIVPLVDMEGMVPPSLEGEGKKVQIDWLARFLHRPMSLRPWLNVRMPTFGLSDREVTVLARYFTALDGRDAFFTFAGEHTVPAAHAAVGKRLFSELKCASCHPKPGEKPSAEVAVTDLAPDFALSRRLRYDWILEFLKDPQVPQPETRMPTYFPDGQTSIPEILGGDARRQIKALADYTYSVGRP